MRRTRAAAARPWGRETSSTRCCGTDYRLAADFGRNVSGQERGKRWRFPNLGAMRGPGESYSELILRLVAVDTTKPKWARAKR
jgi:hypothetical protein